MEQRVLLSDRKGFTLIEMLVAMVIILVALLGLVQAALLSIDSNLRNLSRDEAVRLAEERMNVLKNKSVDNEHLPPGGPICDPEAVKRTFRNMSKSFLVCTTITNLGDEKRKSLQVVVGWDHKKELPPPYSGPTLKEFQYSMTSIIERS
jgi:type IV pilus assembly protein PilV